MKVSMATATKFAHGMKYGFELLIRMMGPLFVLIASVLITLVAYVHFIALIPYNTPYFSFFGIINTVVSCYIAFCIGFNYVMVVTTSPGIMESEILSPEEAQRIASESQPSKGQGWSRWCKACKKSKPPRSHHCHICKTCVLKMDHHCPWIGNCVGFYNHKYFILFMFYLCVGCAYVAVSSFKPFLAGADLSVPWDLAVSRGAVTFSFIITVAIFFAVGGLCSWHFYLALSNQTTIEFYFNQVQKRDAAKRGEAWESEFDLGVKKNFELFFGPGKYWFSWLLPTMKPIPGDGTAYLTRYHQTRPNRMFGAQFDV